MSIIVICPSRGRPEKAKQAYDSFGASAGLPATDMVFVVDKDDPTLPAYRDVVPVVSFDHEGGGMAAPMNAAVPHYWDKYGTVGFVGDDHRFRTKGWDQTFEEIMERPGIGMLYGNDLIRQDIPTQVFIKSAIVRALGWFCLPGAKHLYLDNTWATLGRGANCLLYCPEVIIEHEHPVVGKGTMDEGYARVNAPSMYEHDGKVFNAWVASGQAQIDVETVRRALSEAEA